MKKLLCLLLAVLLVVTLVSCNSKSTAEQPPKVEETKPAPIELTTSNIGDYLSFSCRGGEIRKSYNGIFVSGDSNLIFSSYPIAPGYFKNVKVTLSTTVPSGWRGSGTITVTIPADGRLEGYSSSISVNDLYPTDKYVATYFEGINKGVSVVSVSGTFQPE